MLKSARRTDGDHLQECQLLRLGPQWAKNASSIRQNGGYDVLSRSAEQRQRVLPCGSQILLRPAFVNPHILILRA